MDGLPESALPWAIRRDQRDVSAQAVFEKAESLTTADYLSQVSVIKTEKETAENAVFERLTEDVMKMVELGTCSLADG